MRQFRALNFPVIMGKAIAKIAGTSAATNEIMNNNLVTDDGFLVGFNKAIHSTISAGSDLDRLNREAIGSFSMSMDGLTAGGARYVPLFSWVRSEVLLGTTDAVYGPSNPFRVPDIEKAWYTFEPGVTTLALKFIPSFLNGKTLQARERIVQAFIEYFRSGNHKSGSGLVQARYEYIVRKHKIHDLVDVARLEVAGAFGTTSNSAPTAFWLLYHLFSNPCVLEECRNELSTLIEERNNAFYVDMNGVPRQCPTIVSSFNEVLRYHGVQVSLRKVVEDHALDERFLLKKGSALMMPATVQHFDRQIWGPNSETFDHKRFIRSTDNDSSKKGAQRIF
ncbi:hypothetical protein SLS63_005246 [Diaporthe eres]|uniref:Cytochrome P450 n=1 Tax=Diaporthe eres TaxID=83184 RepID=A0ABR1PBT0_DIAER